MQLDAKRIAAAMLIGHHSPSGHCTIVEVFVGIYRLASVDDVSFRHFAQNVTPSVQAFKPPLRTIWIAT
jgi:hypothetical protein